MKVLSRSDAPEAVNVLSKLLETANEIGGADQANCQTSKKYAHFSPKQVLRGIPLGPKTCL